MKVEKKNAIIFYILGYQLNLSKEFEIWKIWPFFPRKIICIG
jgi:hypothetical protein